MSRARGKRYDEKPKLNIKKVLATIIAIAVFIMFVSSLKNLLTTPEVKKEVSTVTTYFTVFENNKWGVIDNNGNTILETNQDEMIVIPDNTKGLFICTYDVNYETGEHKTKVLNEKGKEIFNNYDLVEPIENYDDNSVWYEKEILKYQKDGKLGLIDFSGKEIVPAEYDKIYAMPGVEKSIIVEKDGLLGLISSSLGEIIIDAKYAEISSLGNTYENGYIVKNTDSYYGLITTDKKEILQCKYDKIYNVISNEMFVVTESGKDKVINKSGEDVLTNGFSEVISIDGEYLVIKNNDKYGVIDTSGNSQIPCEYDFLAISFDKTYIAKKDNKYGLVKIGNEVVLDFKYSSMSYRKVANFIEADDENFKTDIIDKDLKVVLSGVIISEINTDKGYIRVRAEENYKYYNFQFEEKKAQEVMPTHTLFLVKENGKYGFENKNGERIVDCIYDDATEQNDYGYSAVKKGGVWGSLKADGTVCLEPSVNLDNNLYINFIEKWHVDENSKNEYIYKITKEKKEGFILELKTKYQYTYFIHPYVVDETRYDKYILKLFKDKKCKFKIFQKEKDLDIYNYFLPQVRDFAFPTFELRGQKLKDFNNLSKEAKSKIVSKQYVACFDYNLSEDIQGKMGEENGIFFKIAKIQIICFNTGICFLAIKTHIEGNEDFADLLDFNYRFKSINSEFSSLKDYENINIQTDIFNDVKDISELISQITGIYEKKIIKTTEELSNSNFFVYSYVCIESDKWNEKNEFLQIENEFYKYANCLPRQYLSDFNKTNIEQNLHIIEKFKYSKIALTNSSVNIMCSGIDTFNYTKLPYQYENEYFYTYILTLYQKMFLKRLNADFKEYDKIAKMRAKFINFTKQIWEKEITLDDTGSLYYKTIKKTLELDELYDEIKTKYEIIYKDLNIEKNNSYYSIIIILLIFSLIFNTVNILFLMYLLG